jgi:putative hydrolase of the HAD superfamily
MYLTTSITTLFLDIGEVLLTNGWGPESRHLAADKFNLDFNEFDTRHAIAFEICEIGKLTMDGYLDIAVFMNQEILQKKNSRSSCLLNLSRTRK